MRNSKSLATALDNECGDNGEGQRNFNGKCRTLSFFRGQGNGAADFLDIRTYHIHPDTAARDIGDFLSRRKTGTHNKVLDLLGAHPLQFSFTRQTVIKHFLLDLLAVQSASIIGNLDDDMTTFMIGIKDDFSGFRFPVGQAVRRDFQTMVGRISDHVRQRIFNQFENLPVQLCFRTQHD